MSSSALPMKPRGASPAWSQFVGWIAAGITLLTLAFLSSRESYPPMPGTLTLELTFPAAAVGHDEPIICTGMHREGDLLVVRYVDESTAVFKYDHWGSTALTSKPITFHAGSRHVLRVEMPSLTTYEKPPADARAWLRVDCDGQPVLHAEVAYNGRQRKQIFFGTNPIGASANPVFRGAIRTDDGRKPAGGPESYFTFAERLSVWIRAQPWHAAGVVLLSVVVGVVVGRIAASPRTFACAGRIRRRWTNAQTATPPLPVDERTARRSLSWFAGSMSIATIGYAWLVTGGTFNFDRAEVFGSFYDYQAASLLQGRLDVPEEAIGAEAFEARGRLYGYFGPTPALLRMPFVAAGIAFGKLSRAFMVLYFISCLLSAWLILREALHMTARNARSGMTRPMPSACASVVMVGSVGLGSTILFLGSRGLVFHEAILAGITFALWCCWFSLRYLNDAGRWWIAALVCGVLAVHARPTTGLFALTFLGCVALARMVMAWKSLRRVSALRGPMTVALLTALGFVSLNGLAWLKFRTFDPAPLRISRPYKTPGRLQYIDGKSLHLVNVPFNTDTYLLRPNFRLEQRFPWIYLGSRKPRREFSQAKVDLPDFTLAIPYAMPSLFFLGVIGSLGSALALPATRLAIAALWAAVMPMTFALFAAVATAQRYTGDFCPFLICGAGFGLAAMGRLPAPPRSLIRAAVVLFTVAAMAVNVAVTLHYQGETLWGVPEETRRNYQLLRQRIDTWFGVPTGTPTDPLPPPKTDVDI